MNKKAKLLLALTQVENIAKLVEGNPWQGFISSHLLTLKYEFERQLSLEKSND
jgi:hypothetical protein